PAIVVETERPLDDAARVALTRALAAAEASPFTRGIARFLFHPSFPVDIRHNAKINREELAVWAAERFRGA
ncbi:MAG: peptide synthase, partial [Planctomycetes bacterium]|nr:peptide synthase [Planctomycetota bacterium]